MGDMTPWHKKTRIPWRPYGILRDNRFNSSDGTPAYVGQADASTDGRTDTG